MKHKLQNKYSDYLNQFIHHRIGGDCILEGCVLNLVTKERYYEKPTIITMRLALQKMKKICIKEGITKIAMPTIGAGLDRLKWDEVKNQIENVFWDTDIEILICKRK